jgi:Chaperone of endosialidase
MNPLIQLKKATPLFLVALVCFGLSPMAQALLPPPPPDGGYPGGNTAEGDLALFNLTTGDNNTAVGFRALFTNTIGSSNTATGHRALLSNTGGVNNTANGVNALRFNTMGNGNTAIGFHSLYYNSDSFNTAIGEYALASNTTGHHNTANGVQALLVNSTGSDNTAVGYFALVNNRTGDNNTALGWGAGLNTTGNNNIAIGNIGGIGESGTIRIGTAGTHTVTIMAGISGATVTNGAPVMVNPSGKLGTMLSAARFKEAIKPMDKASEAILALKPVTFRYKPYLDPDGIPQFGLIAEQVEKVNPNLVTRDADGNVATVRYEAVNAMLLNEFHKEHRKNEEQEATIAELRQKIDVLTAALQKVSAQLK